VDYNTQSPGHRPVDGRENALLISKLVSPIMTQHSLLSVLCSVRPVDLPEYFYSAVAKSMEDNVLDRAMQREPGNDGWH
jgi:hypothetical protein